MLARVSTWWTIFKICVEERLVYRGDFALGTLMRFLPIVTQIFLWTAVFASAGTGNIQGYSRDDVIAYYLLTMLVRAFSSMPGLATGIARQVREGEIKKFLIQPIDLLSYLLLARIAHKVVYYLVAAGPFALVFYLCRDYFPGWPPAEVFVAFLVLRAAVVPAGILYGSHDGHDRLLVSRSLVAAVRAHAVYILLLGSHVPAGVSARAVENNR